MKVEEDVIIIINEFTHEDGERRGRRKKRTANRLFVTNVRGLLLTCFAVTFTCQRVNVFWSLKKRSV